MYCDNCGAPLQQGSVFCTQCGNSLSARETAKKEGSVLALILILVLWLLPVVWEFVYLIYKIFQYRESVPEEFFALLVQNNVDTFLKQALLPSGACLLLAVILTLCRAIDVRKIGWWQFLTAVFLAVLCGEGLGAVGNVYLSQLGTEQLVAYSSVRSVVTYFKLHHLWRWIVLLIFLVVVSHKRLHTGLVLGVSALGLAVWSAVSLSQLGELVETYNMESSLQGARLALILIWVSRMVVVCAALLAGKRILRNGMTGLCVAVRVLGKILLLPVLVFAMDLGVTGAMLTEPLVSVVIGIICLIGFIVYKNKNRAAA